MSSKAGNEDLVADYLGEAQEYLEHLNQGVLAASEAGGKWSKEEVNGLFRVAHSLKGLSACFGFERTSTLTHHLESLMSRIRDGALHPTQQVVRAMFRAIDLVTHLTAEIASSGSEVASIELVVAELERAATAPSAETVDERAAATPVEEGPGTPASGGAATSGSKSGDSNETVRVRLDRLDKLVNMTGELVITRSRFQLVGNTLRSLARVCDLAPEIRELTQALRDLHATLQQGSGRLSADAIGELLEHAEQLQQPLEDLGNVPRALKDLEEASYDLDGVVSGIHDSVLQVRMVPLDSVFRRLSRVVRDTAEACGKQVQLAITGAETQIDKRVADELVNPLVHLLRNAVDHGLEKPANRRERGKPLHGTIQVRSFQRGSSVVIEVVDDGGGIDPARVLRKAVEIGLVTAEEGAAMPIGDVQRLIMKPGFSTAAEVTAVSGRGMGMDIVEASIKKLRGSLDLHSDVGKGTTFTIQLPPSMSILSSLLLQVRGTTFALPLTEVREIVELAAAKVHRVQSRDVIIVRERPMPLVSLPCAYRFADAAEETQPTHAVVLGFGRQEVALGVDRLLGKEDLVIKPLCAELENVRGLAGMAIRGDGRVTLILEPASFAEHALQRSMAAAV